MTYAMRLVPALLAATILFSACEKIESYDNNTPPPANPPGGGGGTPTTPTTPAAPRLVRVFELDTTLMHPFDTIGRLTLSYDAQGRLSNRLDIAFDEITGDTASVHQHQYFYNSAFDSLATRVRRSLRNAGTGSAFVQDKYFTHVNGLLVKDSVVSASAGSTGYRVWRYTQAPNFVGLTGLSGDGLSRSSSNFYQTWQGANLTQQLDTMVEQYGTQQPMYLRSELITTYLDKPNPFFKPYRAWWENWVWDAYGLGAWFNTSKHLIQQRTWNTKSWNNGGTPSIGTRTITYSYVFGAHGYPTRITEVTVGSSVNEHRTLVLQYQ
ncbi:hypothetical protein [Flaviaesturariibacter amylovorans]|uniref:DUF4595 domain-containing protein n=1 Tax=Flaviaesturariibacter amylovorans TaxID=1084520 RepID=A0ABP8HF56_9BACT